MLYPPSSTEITGISFANFFKMTSVTHAKSSFSRFIEAKGSNLWASKPAEKNMISNSIFILSIIFS